jgi:hypothetical protein
LKRNLEAITELKQNYEVHTRGRGIKGTMSSYNIKEAKAPNTNGLSM